MENINYSLKTIDNFDLDVIRYNPTISNGNIIVMCHGLTGVKQGRTSDDTYLFELAQKLCEKGFSVVQFDWRGHGKSGGEDKDVCCDSFFKDLDAVIKNDVVKLKLNFWGWAIGGFSILQYL